MKARAENSGKLWTAQEDERLRELAVSSATRAARRSDRAGKL